ncbi:hypothetical protein [Nostoc sp. DedQUE04]|uniref:hypothetical protein n=1 Tax=Nostoc sp. DedQUE04 TaxID=3075390 RepID=UPI002AD24931|nr:hypothetical protein [Nostoc sp. DedQUE04]
MVRIREAGGEVAVTISLLPPYPMPHTQCPMPNAQCPMPNTQYPTTNDSIDLGSILESNKCLQLYLISSSWVYSLAYL